MIWFHPWALLGILGVGLPVVIHLFGRGHADARRFPSLRFIEASRLMPTRRTRIHDAWLLLIRCAIIALAASALAHPLVMTARRWTSLDRGRARAIIVDTSFSMKTPAVGGRAAVSIARDSAKRLVSRAQSSVVVESNDPGEAITDVSQWIARQQREGEIVILSDFQSGSLDRADLNEVPKETGLVFARIGAPTDSLSTVLENGRGISGTRRRSEAGLLLQWSSAREPTADWRWIVLLASARDSGLLAATRSAAATVPVRLPIDTTRMVTVVFPGGELAAGTSLHSPSRTWMADLLVELHADSIGIQRFGEASNGQLVLFVSAAPGSIESARLVADVRRSSSIAPAVSELESNTLPDDTLRAWSRPPTAGEPSAQHRPMNDEGPSDARWFWIGAVILLVIEMLARRTRQTTKSAEEARARAA
jgi:hypothetical protein